jgi:hypothetical protein
LADQTEKLLGLTELTKSAGWYLPHKGICWISERHCVVIQDEQRRIHCENGPAIAYPDGWSIYAIHGVRLPEYVIMRTDEITVEKIQTESNTEVRRIMIDRYKRGEEISGAAAYLRDGNALRLDHDDAWGTLWKMPIADDEDIVCVEVVNRTPEPDGHFKHYFLRCAPNLKPLRADGSGRGQKMTALNAVASTFGLTGAEYAKQLDFES